MDEVSDSTFTTKDVSKSLLGCMLGSTEGDLLYLFLGGMCTRVCVPVVFVMRAVLFAHELLVHDFFELDHFDGCETGVCVDAGV
jgi:hypothetical protein